MLINQRAIAAMRVNDMRKNIHPTDIKISSETEQKGAGEMLLSVRGFAGYPLDTAWSRDETVMDYIKNPTVVDFVAKSIKIEAEQLTEQDVLFFCFHLASVIVKHFSNETLTEAAHYRLTDVQTIETQLRAKLRQNEELRWLNVAIGLLSFIANIIACYYQALTLRVASSLAAMTGEDIVSSWWRFNHPNQPIPTDKQALLPNLNEVFDFAHEGIRDKYSDNSRLIFMELMLLLGGDKIRRFTLHLINTQQREPFLGIITSHCWTILKKISEYVLAQKQVVWSQPDSYQQKTLVLARVLLQSSLSLDKDVVYRVAWLLTSDFAVSVAAPLIPISAEEQTRAVEKISTSLLLEIDGLTNASTNSALLRYLGGILLDDNLLQESGLTMSEIFAVVTDLPDFYQLEKTLAAKTNWSESEATPGAIRALALAAITDYLYPASQYQAGYISGFNLYSVTQGSLTFSKVLEALRIHLKMRSGWSEAESDLATVFLARRYAPELLVKGIPNDLSYGLESNAIYFRYGVALAEMVQPGSTMTLDYDRLLALPSTFAFDTLNASQQQALMVLQRAPLLHYAITKKVIPECNLADIILADEVKALDYVTKRQAQEQKDLNALLAPPPDRKKMARAELARVYPRLNVDEMIPASSITLPTSVGMRTPVLTSVAMTKLESYMTHDTDFSFDITSFGQPSGTALNASQLEEKFNTDFNIYQNNYRAALCSRLALAIADLPSLHRENLLKASHFLQVAFKDDDDSVQPAYQGVVVVGEGNNVQPFTFAYDIFPLTGVIRMLPVIANSNNSLNKPQAHSTMLSMGWQIPTPQLSVGEKLGLRYPLNANTYGVEIKKTDKYWQIPLLSARFAFSDLGSGDEKSKIQRFSEQLVDKVFGEPVKQLRQVCRRPTAYEQKTAADAATRDLLCRILIPFYSTIQDIKEGTLTVGGVIFGAIELLSFIIPFGLAAHAGASVFMAAGKIGVKFSALGVSNFALQSAKTAVAAKQASKVLASGLADAVNPFNFVGPLFQGGKKVASVVQGNYQALRQQLNTLPSLARLKQLSSASEATTDLALAQRSLAHYELKGLTANALRSEGNNLYSDKLGKNYLEIDNKLYLSSPDAGDGRYIYSPLNYRDKFPVEWIDAKWQPTGHYGRLLGGGPFIGQRYRTANAELAKIVSQAGQKAEDFTPLQTEAFVNGLTNLVKGSNADSYDNIKEYAEAGSRLINSQLRAQQTSPELANFLREFNLLNDYTGVAYRSAYVTSNGAMRIREGIGKVFIDHGVQSASSQYINVNSWHQSPWVRSQAGQSATQPAVFIFDSSIAKKNMATSFLKDHVAIAPDTSLQVLSTRMVADTLYVYFSAPPHRIDQRYRLFDGKLIGG